ncbi:hypothetical protein [Legionella tucsonensis]|uniref:Uncharacterized protein n=1 Tax=Legionella tucsonensis TaxID=40335 RepID=A0A0W0ZQB0_9GAMM|nr:hypothetical protein [Legionella tucsonensis]KTD71218.1 hypothetical protein Ltuc_2577 [Legionella tucsonensis]
MSKKGSILCTTLLLSSAMAFADTDMQSNGTNINANEQNATTSTPSTDTSTPSSTDTNTPSSTDTNASGTTPSSNGQGTSNTNINQTTNVDVTNVNANVTEVNNKVSITGVTTAPTFTNVEIRNNVYYLPETVTPTSGFYFLNINSTERVCSLEKITAVKVLSTPTTITVMTREKEHTLYCYERQDFNF